MRNTDGRLSRTNASAVDTGFSGLSAAVLPTNAHAPVRLWPQISKTRVHRSKLPLAPRVNPAASPSSRRGSLDGCPSKRETTAHTSVHRTRIFNIEMPSGIASYRLSFPGTETRCRRRRRNASVCPAADKARRKRHSLPTDTAARRH
jgi:hypothetical protein